MSSNIPPPIQLSTGTNESAEDSHVDPAKEVPERRHQQGPPVVEKSWYVIVHRGRKMCADAPFALATRHLGSADMSNG